MEIDLGTPLRSHFRMRDKDWRIEYKGLQDICFLCRKYGHKEQGCLTKATPAKNGVDTEKPKENPVGGEGFEANASSTSAAAKGPWMVVQRRSRRGARVMKGNSINSSDQAVNAIDTENRGKSLKEAEIAAAKIAVNSKTSNRYAKSTGSIFAALDD